MNPAPWLCRWTETVLGFIYPTVCQVCNRARATAADGCICDTCRQGVQRIEPPFCNRCGLPFGGDLTTSFECSNCRGKDLSFTTARSAAVARGVTLEVIHRYKYKRALWFEPFLAQLLIESAAPALPPAKWDMIVPVPLHPVKEREREFNQAQRLAKHLSRATGIPLHHRCIRRVKATRTQTQLSQRERAANMRGAFAARSGLRLEGRRVVLIDDVLTTGATTNACARVLKGAGAGEVCVWTVARGV